MNPINFINPDGSNREDVKATFTKVSNLLLDHLILANEKKSTLG